MAVFIFISSCNCKLIVLTHKGGKGKVWTTFKKKKNYSTLSCSFKILLFDYISERQLLVKGEEVMISG